MQYFTASPQAATGWTLLWLADSSWFPILADFVREVVQPNSHLFIVLVVAFELAVGAFIFSRGRLVDMGVGASVLWVLFLMPFLRPFPMAATNVLLAIVQGILLLRRYDTSIWGLLKNLSGPRGPREGGLTA